MTDDNDKPDLKAILENRAAGFEQWKTNQWTAQELKRVSFMTGVPEERVELPFGGKKYPTSGKFLEIGERVHREMEKWLNSGYPGGLTPKPTVGCFCDVHGSGHSPGCRAVEKLYVPDEPGLEDCWVSQDGRVIRIAELEQRHLENIYRLLVRAGCMHVKWAKIEAEYWRRIEIRAKDLGYTSGRVGSSKPSMQDVDFSEAELTARECVLDRVHGRTSSSRPTVQEVPRGQGTATVHEWEKATRLHNAPPGEYLLEVIGDRPVNRGPFGKAMIEYLLFDWQSAKGFLWCAEPNRPLMRRFLHCTGVTVAARQTPIGSRVWATVKDVRRPGSPVTDSAAAVGPEMMRIVNWKRFRPETP